ncbi:hypothetical protein F7Q99_07760 [Streptomyces kaniharaensis]|uniref:DUF4352 domain-containing protein n=1 Tax=Streptomyces kaniharaensis TaxID=212423 RepID=A0A6N7KL04_9ACTN|nr:hypothetical protein [Streptomyces kaniharaensis]MQS12192.1 hypothetical protein [Streptomyces kaniharaensis]
MRSYTTKLTVAAVAAAAAISLAACGPDNSDTNGGATGGGTAAPAPTSAGPGAASGGAATGGSTSGGTATGGAATGGATGGSTAAPSGGASGGAAAGGAATGGATTGGGTGGKGLPQAATAVKFGQPATVDFNDKMSNGPTKLEITITGITPGSIKDFQDAKAPTTGLDGRDLFYVSWTMKNLTDTKMAFTSPDSKLLVFDANGKTSSFANPTAATPISKCTLPPSFSVATKGAEVKGCDIVSFPAGSTPVLVGYTNLTDNTKLQASWAK